jgi:hypothetical protein
MPAPEKRGPMPIEERAKRFLASYSKHGGQRRAKSFKKLGEMDQCRIVEQVLGEALKPANDGIYYLTCPGVSFHSNKSGLKDCRFTPGDGGHNPRTAAPALHCVHQSCGTVIEEMNRLIRSEIGKASVEYLTDHGSVLNNAAAALIIGFDLDDMTAHKLLVAWGKTCTPIHTAAACGSAISAALAAYKKKPDEVGYLLNRARRGSRAPAVSPTTPSIKRRTSFASVPSNSPVDAELVGQPIYLGVKGKVAKQARAVIDAYRDDYCEEPTVLLLGPDQPDVGSTLCGLRVEAMRSPGISVCRDTRDANDG